MRKDMQRVIITRGRIDYRFGTPYRRSRAKRDDAPQAPMSRGRGSKGFTDNLAPLCAFLAKRCGTPWDDVWSEVCAVTDARSVIGRHLRNHLRELVTRKAQPWMPALRYPGWHVGADGILRANEAEAFVRGRWRETTDGPPTVDAGDGTRYEQHAGIWYHVRDAVVRTEPAPELPGGVRREVEVPAMKRQLDSRRLRRLGLRNDPR